MYRALFLLSLISVTLSQDLFFKKYGYSEIMSNCFGKELYFSVFVSVFKDVRWQCNREPVNITGLNFQDLPLPNDNTDQNDSGYPPIFDAEYVRAVAVETMSVISNLTCLLRYSGFVDSNNNILYDKLVREFREQNLTIDIDLKQDIIDGFLSCKDLVTCLPVQKQKSPLPDELLRIMAMVKCERKSRLVACLKHDLRKNLKHFARKDLPSDGGKTDDVEKLAYFLIGAESRDELELI